jgi:hypothetical protein
MAELPLVEPPWTAKQVPHSEALPGIAQVSVATAVLAPASAPGEELQLPLHPVVFRISGKTSLSGPLANRSLDKTLP